MASKESRSKTKDSRQIIDKTKSDKLVKIGIVLVTVAFIFIIYKIFDMVVSTNQRVKLSGENYYQDFMGIRKEYSGEIEVIRTDNSTQLVLEDKSVVNLDSTPIYYKDILGRLILPSEMELINVYSGSLYRLDAFTNVIQDSEIMYVKKHNKDNKKSINNTFIYDGSDLYLFLEETQITVGKKKYKVSPLSYAIVNYRQNIEIYDYDKDEYTIISEDQVPEDDIIATNKNKDYKINMSVDSFTTGSSDQLLVKNISYLHEYDY